MLTTDELLNKEFKNWDPDNFDWNFSYMLAEDCSNYFEVVVKIDKMMGGKMSAIINVLKKNKFENWNPDDFDWEKDFWDLAKDCYEYFDIWWDPDKIDWGNDSWALCMYCSRYINEWWDSEKFNWLDNLKSLCLFSYKYINVWWDVNKILNCCHRYDIDKYILNNKKIPDRYKLELKLLLEWG